MDEVVLVTGASAGIGLACANRLHQRGWKVFGASRRGTSPGGWMPLVVDVDLDGSVAGGFEQLLATDHRLDAVVACAGWGLAGAAELTPVAQAKEQMETNFWGAVRVVQHALPVMRGQGHGRIILISSIGGIIGLPFQSFYSASKFAMEGYGEALAYEVAPFGIQVTLVEPGNVCTEFTGTRRMVRGSTDHDPYGSAATRAVRTMSEDEVNGVAPDTVALTVDRVLRARHPPRRVSSGRFDERIGTLAKRLLPYRLFEKAAKGSLGV
jgi:NAD(P)-dependent dehydrogenase (short-subunit alcohol dehydrogenase family)